MRNVTLSTDEILELLDALDTELEALHEEVQQADGVVDEATNARIALLLALHHKLDKGE